MYRYVVILVTVFFILNNGICDVFEEPVCSKFHFEEKVLEKLIKLEIRIDGELKQIADKTNQLETRLTTLSDSMAKIQSTVHENSQLETRLTTLSDSMAEIQSTVQDNNQVEDKITGLSSSIKDIIRDLQSNVSAHQTILVKDVSAIGKKKETPVLFVAHTPPTSLAQGRAVVFQKTAVSQGNGYDTNTGIFTAPVGGVYVFTVQLCLPNGYNVKYQIVVNDSPYSSSMHYGSYKGVCSSSSTTTLLSKGDRVWVAILNGGVEVLNQTGSVPIWNMFTGTLVNQVTY